ncbi:hypothetical protein SKAU_G00160630 [Synaphobranchus kaupii]|uniref:Uncharacterized protein n=1 Tax=Synaphobranchus kaupii TaxID=118154 RepID=A0A9Q1IZD8_SYNKA|nr:hypothetical protein SKAU_G00160630 [Synaphobranchus kaupii]
MNRLVTTGETDGSSERRQLGRCGLAALTAPPVKVDPKQAADQRKELYPQGSPRGGEDEHPSRTGLAPGETEEEAGPEAPHRAQSLQVVQTVPPLRQSEKKGIRWLQACQTTEWQRFDEDVDKVLEATAKGDMERRLRTMTTTMVSIAAERQVPGQRRSGPLACSEEEVDLHLHNNFSDPIRDQDLRNCEPVIRPPEPTEAFDLREPLLKEVQDVVKKARSRSAPGLSGTSYKVYKHCPKLLHRLRRIF